MLHKFINNIVNSLLSCAEELRDRKKAQRKSHVHGDPHSHSGRRRMPYQLGRATFEDIPEELRCYILSFLSGNDIMRCASTCQKVYNTVKSSAELQYTIELGAQRLIEVHPRSPTVSSAECLRILRNKANTWNSFQLDDATAPCDTTLLDFVSISHKQILFSTRSARVDALSHAVNIKTITTTSGHLVMNQAPHTFRYIDELQDLEITIKLPVNVDSHTFKCQILSRMISTGEEHPLAHGSHIVTSRAAFRESQTVKISVSVLGDRLAVYFFGRDENGDLYWSLHVLSWYQCNQADDICAIGNGNQLHDFRFLTKEKLLVLSSDNTIELYNIEDLSIAPQLQARFMLPIHYHQMLGGFFHSLVFHNTGSHAHLAAPDNHWIWTTHPADQVIYMVFGPPSSAIIISARICFMDIPPAWFDVASEDGRSVPWSSWGPQNSRYFSEDMFNSQVLPARTLGVGGSRVIRAVPVAGRSDSPFRLHMMDFNPSAVARGIGKVVRKPTSSMGLQQDMQVRTYLPFVEVVHDQVFDGSPWSIAVNEEVVVVITELKMKSERKLQAKIFFM
ncbi:hypothetical protein DEU56DRAFT_900305 [Suillus clintonianus]|uniref:uncharacterized protein n=1 Tax=Suillus clintonianus TaxID=1904413 RepID=UPI001B86E471|nr:uncharacterized protein DEU56DRAFT_900305 [Suillus clintonianus]KAG2142969.1 hypothetical protein DEU56DRAFT_900305 [Suillus clintonianus]